MDGQVDAQRGFHHLSLVDVDHHLVGLGSQQVVGVAHLTDAQSGAHNDEQVGVLHHDIADAVAADAGLAETQRVVMPDNV